MANLMALSDSLQMRLERLNVNIARLSKIILSTPSLDALLSTLSYAALLLSTLPPSRSSSTSKPFSSTSNTATTLRARLKALSSLLSGTRTTFRLFSLPLLCTSFVRLSKSPAKDTLVRRIAYAQAFAGLAFQLLENGAWLAEKGVIPREKLRGGVSKWWLWSGRFWMLGTLLEGGRLILQAREKKKKVPQVIEKSSSSSSGGKAHGKRRAVGEEELGTSTDSLATPPNVGVSIAGEVFSDAKDTLIAPAAPATAEIEEKEQRTITQENEKEAAAKYWRSVATNAAYAPMTLHYSMEKGFMGDSWIGALGLAASAVGLGEVWRSTAAGAE